MDYVLNVMKSGLFEDRYSPNNPGFLSSIRERNREDEIILNIIQDSSFPDLIMLEFPPLCLIVR